MFGQNRNSPKNTKLMILVFRVCWYKNQTFWNVRCTYSCIGNLSRNCPQGRRRFTTLGKVTAQASLSQTIYIILILLTSSTKKPPQKSLVEIFYLSRGENLTQPSTFFFFLVKPYCWKHHNMPWLKHILCKWKKTYIQKERVSISRILAKRTATHRWKGEDLNEKDYILFKK